MSRSERDQRLPLSLHFLLLLLLMARHRDRYAIAMALLSLFCIAMLIATHLRDQQIDQALVQPRRKYTTPRRRIDPSFGYSLYSASAHFCICDIPL